MSIKRSLMSLFLILTMLFTVPATIGNNVRAADTQKITNIKVDSNGVLTWDKVPGASHYQAGAAGYAVALLSSPKVDLYELLSKNGIDSGTYTYYIHAIFPDKPSITAEGKYDFVSPNPKLGPITNLRIEGDYLVWDHDLSATPDVKPYYSVEAYNEKFKRIGSYETRIPISSFATNEPNYYHCNVTASADGYISTESETVTFNNLSFDLKPITGMKYEYGSITWDAFPNATRYEVYMSYLVDGSEHSSYNKVNKNAFNIGQEASFITDDKAYDINVSITAYQETSAGMFKISDSTAGKFTYKYETFPLYFMKDQITTKYDLNNVTGNGKVSYNPAENKLILNDLNLDNHYYPSFVYPGGPLFESTGSLTVTGSAVIENNRVLFKAAETLTFDDNCNIVLHSEDTPVIASDKLNIRSGSVEFVSSADNVVSVSGDISVSNKITSVKAKTDAASKAALSTQNGKIILSEGVIITEPANGKVSKDGKTICSSNGATATSVSFSVDPNYPSPTPVPTATPTARPTTRPTAAPTAKPTATTAPKATATPKATAAPKPTVTAVPADPNAQILAFVERIYTYVLDREPEAEGAAFWSEELYAFRRTGAEVAQGFIFSDEFTARNTSDEEFVTIIYKTFFGRDPEEEGMNFWLSQLSSGAMDRITVANGFIYSQEWADTCASYGIRSGGELKPTGKIEPTALTYAFVERMYTTAMGRSYDEEGRQYWASELANFNITGEQCGAAFFLSSEMEGYGLSDKDFLGRLYKTFMNREADADGSAYWLGVMASGTSRADIVYGFTRSPEFTDKCVEARILPY